VHPEPFDAVGPRLDVLDKLVGVPWIFELGRPPAHFFMTAVPDGTVLHPMAIEIYQTGLTNFD
jgi:hypothetical protein